MLFRKLIRKISKQKTFFQGKRADPIQKRGKSGQVYASTRTREGTDFDKFLEKKLAEDKLGIVHRQQLRLEHLCSDKKLNPRERKRLEHQLEDSVVSPEFIMNHAEELDFMNFLKEKDRVILFEAEATNTNEVRQVEPEQENLRDYLPFNDRELLLEKITEQLQNLCQSVMAVDCSNFEETQKHFMVAGVSPDQNLLIRDLARRLSQELRFFKRNNIRFEVNALEINPDSANIAECRDYLLVDCSVERRKNLNREHYLVQPTPNPDLVIIKKKKLSLKPKASRVTRVSVEFSVDCDFEFYLPDNVEPIQRFQKRTSIVAQFENVWLEFDYRANKRLFEAGHYSDFKGTYIDQFRNLRLIDLNYCLKGNFFIK